MFWVDKRSRAGHSRECKTFGTSLCQAARIREVPNVGQTRAMSRCDPSAKGDLGEDLAAGPMGWSWHWVWAL